MDLVVIGVAHHLSPVEAYVTLKLLIKGINHLLRMFCAGGEDTFESAKVFGTSNKASGSTHKLHLDWGSLVLPTCGKLFRYCENDIESFEVLIVLERNEKCAR